MEMLTSILQWLIPAGGLGTVVAWIFSKTLRQLRTTKEVHDTYKQLYENIKSTLTDLQDENKKLYRAVSKLERVISRASTCRHYFSDCPIKHELLREQEDGTKSKNRKRQHTSQGSEAEQIRADPGVKGATDNPC
jgi:chromosome segregation ATPase